MMHSLGFESCRMVYLSKIYTKTGDQGDTSLGDGRRVPKDHPRVTAYGSIDELNAALGLAIASIPDMEGERRQFLHGVQNDLFDVGADLCLPLTPDEAPGKVLRVRPEQTQRLEHAIDQLIERLQPLHSFVLPGGSVAAAWFHLARTICRRAERDVIALARTEAINPQVVIYLNRLSDLLFVLARAGNQDGRNDMLWAPGKSQA